MKCNIFIMLFLFCLQSATAQTSMTREQVLKKLNTTTVKKERVDLLLDLSYLYSVKDGRTTKDIDSSFTVLQQGRQLAKQIKYKQAITKSDLLESIIASNKKDDKRCLALIRHALSEYKKDNDYDGQGEAYVMLAHRYESDGDALKQKIIYFKNAEICFEKAKNLPRQAMTLKDIGDYLQGSNSFNESLIYLEKAVRIYKKCACDGLQGVYILIATKYIVERNLITSLKYALLAEKTAEIAGDETMQFCQIENFIGVIYSNIGDKNAAITHIDKALEIASKYGDKGQMKFMYIAKIQIYISLKNYSEANILIKQMRKITSKTDLLAEQFYGNNYVKLKKYDEAIIHLKNADKLSKGSQNDRLVIIPGYILYYLSQKNYPTCYSYLKEYDDLLKDKDDDYNKREKEILYFKVDSSSNKLKSAIKHYHNIMTMFPHVLAKSSEMSQLEIQYETDKKNREILSKANNISLLNNEALLQKNQIDQSHLTLNTAIGGSAALLLLIGISYNGMRNKQRTGLILKKQKDEINYQNNLLNNLAEKQDSLISEKEWLLREMRERVKNNLETVMSLLSAQLNFLGDQSAQDAVKDSQRRIRAMSLIHQKLQNTNDGTTIHMPDYVSELTLHLIESYNSKRKIIANFNIAPIMLEVSKAVPIGLILNELVTNAIKYAFTDNQKDACITLELTKNDNDEIKFSVSDNGKGFPEDFDIDTASSFGIVLIRGLTDDLDGEFKIENDMGAKFTITFNNDDYDVLKMA